MIDKDGTFAYSAVSKGGCAAPSTLFSIFPNPAHNTATAMLSVDKSSNATINVYSSDGKLVAQHGWALQKGINSFALPEIALLPVGSYIVK